MKTCPQCNLVYPSESSFCFLDGSTLVVPKDPRVGSTLAGRYVIEEALGVGGMATVYRAHHKLVDRPCAVKILSAQFAQDPTTRERFRRESKHAQRLAHPNIIEIFDQGETDDGVPFLVMELLQGSSLAEVVDKGPMPLSAPAHRRRDEPRPRPRPRFRGDPPRSQARERVPPPGRSREAPRLRHRPLQPRTRASPTWARSSARRSTWPPSAGARSTQALRPISTPSA
jgi:hypothetical protein